MPFLEVLTRCYKRPAMLQVNRDSLSEQTDQDFSQTCFIDEVGRGVPWSYDNMTAGAADLTGSYIWILDDDDFCIRPTFIAELKEIVYEHDPDVIMVQMDHGDLGVLPDDDYWGKFPRLGKIGISAHVVRRSVWQEHARSMCTGRYAGDFSFIEAVFKSKPQVYWHRVVASKVQRLSFGTPE